MDVADIFDVACGLIEAAIEYWPDSKPPTPPAESACVPLSHEEQELADALRRRRGVSRETAAELVIWLRTQPLPK